MKVGIITCHTAHNYGSVLQAYALQTKLKELGYDTSIIDYRPFVIEKNYKAFSFKVAFSLIKQPIKMLKYIGSRIFLYPNLKKKRKKFKYFINNYYDLTNTYYNIKSLKKADLNLNAMITGSDQLWNTDITEGIDKGYFLDFGNNDVKKISYAVSLGKPSIDEKYKEEIKALVNRFNSISIRENSAKIVLKELVDKDIYNVLDPTLLINSKYYEEIMVDMNIKEDYILVYNLQETPILTKVVNEISRNTGLKVIHFNKLSMYDSELMKVYDEGPLEYLGLFKNAKYIVTSSYHGTVFALVFKKKFCVVPHTTVGSRQVDLLKLLSLNERLIMSETDFSFEKFDSEIDFETVYTVLDEEKKKSVEFIKNALEK